MPTLDSEGRSDGGHRVWLLMGHRAGDNAQVLGLGEALGWPFEVKRFVYTRYELLVNWPFSSTLAGVEKSRSSALEPPWPELVISAGRRNEPIARWIRRQTAQRVRLVHVGRPWERVERWDLVVTTPQYRLPRVANVVHNQLPLHRIRPERLRGAAAQWSSRLAHLPRPYVVVLAGGSSGPYPFEPASGERLGREADAVARELGGSLLVTTSARTRPETTEALFGAIRGPAFRYRFTPGDDGNPYFALLGLADRVIVTGDSVSMMAEACATGCPVYLFDTGSGRTSMRGWDAPEPLPWWRRIDRAHWKAFVYRQTMRHGPKRLTRDIRIVHRQLVESGRAVWLGEGHPAATGAPRDLERAVSRVRALFGEPAARDAGHHPDAARRPPLGAPADPPVGVET